MTGDQAQGAAPAEPDTLDLSEADKLNRHFHHQTGRITPSGFAFGEDRLNPTAQSAMFRAMSVQTRSVVKDTPSIEEPVVRARPTVDVEAFARRVLKRWPKVMAKLGE
ncbi:hypothetical protein MWN34_16495 [Ancylobacter sp. 6x-1]|uniref:Uncharacterized protein n=1 Tax=Ancylobacter crimeensis TaxID=2579147 RepID=A0ABT0DEY9_9HYPH|nr:hypothetical protein [Ancylobacter crimeensis]MCK0198513.1 hypothetical protein [Ancylobacter crimeensis]